MANETKQEVDITEYDCRAYRNERYVAYETIEASSPEEAMQKLLALEEEGELGFDDYTGNAECADLFIVERHDGPEMEHETANYHLNNAALELLEVIENGKLKSWVHNAALTNDIEALRAICLEWSEWWNNQAIAVIAKAKGEQN